MACRYRDSQWAPIGSSPISVRPRFRLHKRMRLRGQKYFPSSICGSPLTVRLLAVSLLMAGCGGSAGSTRSTALASSVASHAAPTRTDSTSVRHTYVVVLGSAITGTLSVSEQHLEVCWHLKLAARELPVANLVLRAGRVGVQGPMLIRLSGDAAADGCNVAPAAVIVAITRHPAYYYLSADTRRAKRHSLRAQL